MKYFFKRINIFVSNTIFQSSTKYVLMKKSIFLYIYLSICLSVSLNGQSTNSQDVEKGKSIQRNATYNLEEIKVRWKKAALENCTGVPCVPFNCGTSAISDIDGNSYNTVLIGTQCWTKENLKVTKYNDGTTIPDETANTAGWGGLATGARTEYVAVGLSGYVATYGYLYNWYAATEARKICPNGWHVPTDEEWTSLIQFIVPTETISATVIGSQSPTAGGKLKSTSTAMWPAPGFPGSDNYGFSAFPGGYRNDDGSFFVFGNLAFFWSATENATNSSLLRYLNRFNSEVYRLNSYKSVGASVRCLRD
jgi:uncharacterized protein (TIGR02145 family)